MLRPLQNRNAACGLGCSLEERPASGLYIYNALRVIGRSQNLRQFKRESSPEERKAASSSWPATPRAVFNNFC